MKLEMQYPSKSDCINSIARNYCNWGWKLSKFEVNKNIIGKIK